MARDEVRIYRSRKPLKTALAVILSVLAALIVLAAGIFFGFRRYIVYTSDGVKLEVPWLQDPVAPEAPAAPEVTPPETPEAAA